MELNNLVVARYLDGRVLKGMTRDFSANRPAFHVEAAETNEIVELRCRHLKALFFVKTHDGDPVRDDIHGFLGAPPETAQGRKIAVRFRDGEFLCGYTLSWSPDREGFFLFPADPGSNNQRIYVVVSSTDEVKAGPAAEALATRVLASEKARGSRIAGSASTSAANHSTQLARPSGVLPRPSVLMQRPSAIMPRPSSAMVRPASPEKDTDAA